LTDVGRAVRERIRLEAVGRFEGGEKSGEIAAALRVSERSVERWRRQWRERGPDGVRSQGSPGRPRLGEAQMVRLERELERGSLVHGWEDQRWTLARVKALIGRLFHVSYTVEARGGCSNAMADRGSSRPAGRSSVTTRRSSCGRRRCGRG
jgi:transposase